MLRLKPGEFQLLGLLAEGKQPNEVAAELKISRNTYQLRLHRACHKLDAKTAHQAVAIYAKATNEICPVFRRAADTTSDE